MSDTGDLRSLIAANALAANDAVDDQTTATLQRWAQTFAEDGVFEVEGHRIEGRNALLNFHGAVMSRGGVPRHFVGESRLEVSGNSASGAADFLLIDANGVVGMGRYEDSYRRTSDGWRIAHRRATMVGGASPDIAAIAATAGSPG